MSISISKVVKVVITKTTRVVSAASFSIPVILGPSNRFSDPYRVYEDASDMIGDGFMTSDPEYIHAVALTSQLIVPAEFVVSKFTAAVAEVDTFQVNALTTGHVYKFTMNSIVITYTAGGTDTEQSILAALLTAIGAAFPSAPPATGTVTGSGPAAILTLTSTVAGVGISFSAIDSELTHVALTPNHSIVQDLISLQNVIDATSQFYGVLCTSKAASDIEQLAAYIETQLLVYIFASLDAGILTTATTDIFSILKGVAYERTMGIYSASANTQAPDAAWMGYMLPTTPGVGQWALKTLKGVTADNLSDTQLNNILSKNGNAYITMGGIGVTYPGLNFFGEYFDLEILVDWMTSVAQTGIFTVLTDPNNLKIPYSNQGIAMIENPIKSMLSQAQSNQGILPGWTVFGPDIADVPIQDRATRTLNNTGFQAQFAGAIIKVNVRGFVSV